MDYFFLVTSIFLAVVISIPFIRVMKGPTLFDRILGLGAIGTKTLVLICLLGLMFGRLELFVDIALVYSFLNFISFIMVSKYFETNKAKRDAN